MLCFLHCRCGFFGVAVVFVLLIFPFFLSLVANQTLCGKAGFRLIHVRTEGRQSNKTRALHDLVARALLAAQDGWTHRRRPGERVHNAAVPAALSRQRFCGVADTADKLHLRDFTPLRSLAKLYGRAEPPRACGRRTSAAARRQTVQD